MNLFKNERLLVKAPVKDSDATQLAIAFPNTYQVGMASLGYQNAWKILNETENVNAVRWFTDVKEDCSSKPEYIAFSLSWELDFINIFEMLKKEGIPIHAKDRSDNDPIIFAGGLIPSSNPEPFCENFDFFHLGDAEVFRQNLH